MKSKNLLFRSRDFSKNLMYASLSFCILPYPRIDSITTFGILYLMIILTHGGVFPKWEQGSKHKV